MLILLFYWYCILGKDLPELGKDLAIGGQMFSKFEILVLYVSDLSVGVLRLFTVFSYLPQPPGRAATIYIYIYIYIYTHCKMVRPRGPSGGRRRVPLAGPKGSPIADLRSGGWAAG